MSVTGFCRTCAELEKSLKVRPERKSRLSKLCERTGVLYLNIWAVRYGIIHSYRGREGSGWYGLKLTVYIYRQEREAQLPQESRDWGRGSVEQEKSEVASVWHLILNPLFETGSQLSNWNHSCIVGGAPAERCALS